MSRFTEELRVIPRAAWWISIAIYFGLVLLMIFGPLQHDGGQMEPWQLILVAFGVPVIPTLYVLLIGYVYGDAKRRAMRHVMWAWLSLIPYFIGLAAYFILRDPLPQPCPGCRVMMGAGFAFCPHCGTVLRPNCPQCGKSVEPRWVNCAYCGTTLPSPQKVGVGN